MPTCIRHVRPPGRLDDLVAGAAARAVAGRPSAVLLVTLVGGVHSRVPCLTDLVGILRLRAGSSLRDGGFGRASGPLVGAVRRRDGRWLGGHAYPIVAECGANPGMPASFRRQTRPRSPVKLPDQTPVTATREHNYTFCGRVLDPRHSATEPVLLRLSPEICGLIAMSARERETMRQRTGCPDRADAGIDPAGMTGARARPVRGRGPRPAAGARL